MVMVADRSGKTTWRSWNRRSDGWEEIRLRLAANPSRSLILASPLTIVRMTCNSASCEVYPPPFPFSPWAPIAFPSLPPTIICPRLTGCRTDTFRGMHSLQLLHFNISPATATFGTISQGMTCPLIACNAPNWPQACLMPNGTPNNDSRSDTMLP